MRIDAHHHVWRIARGDYGWLTPQLAPIYRDFGVEDLEPQLAAAGIDGTILVQAAPSEAETDFLLEVAGASDVIRGVVGWIDFDAPDAAARIDRLAEQELLVGLRPMVQDLADDDWLLRPQLAAPLAAMARHGLVFDALVLPRHLPRLIRLCRRHPELTVVLDHCAKPPLAGGDLSSWRADIAELAKSPNVVCKISGLVTEAAPRWTVADLRRAVDHARDCFGAARLLWGSDWPVVNLAGDYALWFAAADALFDDLAGPDRAAVFGGNAARVYLRERGKSEGSRR